MGSKGDKLADLARDTREPTDTDRLTSDWGVKQSNTDDWLRVVNNDHTGPSLLEDPFAREKVFPPWHPFHFAPAHHQLRFIASTMSEFPRESCMPAVLAPLGPSE